MISYYDVLGVPRDANEAVIRDRFRVLARAAHPDRFSDPAKKSEAERRFQLLTEALNVLSNPTRRRTHDFDLDKGKANAEFDPENVARVYMAKGVRAYREGQFGDAVQSFELAVRHWGKDARSQHYLAISCLKAGGLSERPPRRSRRRSVSIPKTASITGMPAASTSRRGSGRRRSGMRRKH